MEAEFVVLGLLFQENLFCDDIEKDQEMAYLNCFIFLKKIGMYAISTVPL